MLFDLVVNQNSGLHIPAWKVVSQINPGIQQGRIAQIRDEGWVCLTVTGLNILGTIGHELITNDVQDWQAYADRLAALDWSKAGEVWQDNIIKQVTDAEGKPELDKKGRPQRRILTAQPPVRAAIRKVADAIGWHRPTVADTAVHDDQANGVIA
ncbi:MAG: DNA sulfur modification protein DndB [Bryobacteraceae bacterium]